MAFSDYHHSRTEEGCLRKPMNFTQKSIDSIKKHNKLIKEIYNIYIYFLSSSRGFFRGQGLGFVTEIIRRLYEI